MTAVSGNLTSGVSSTATDRVRLPFELTGMMPTSGRRSGDDVKAGRIQTAAVFLDGHSLICVHNGMIVAAFKKTNCARAVAAVWHWMVSPRGTVL